MQAQTSRGHMYGRAWRVSSHNQHNAIMLLSGEPALHLVSPNSYSLFRDIGIKKSVRGPWYIVYDVPAGRHV